MKSTYTLKLAHINDTHSNFDASRVQFNLSHQDKELALYSHSGGYARIAHQLTQARMKAEKNQQTFLFLHGGDSFQGTLYFNEFKGKANSVLLNLLKPDAMVLGNHEIDAGNGPVLDFLDDIQFPILAGNMDLSRECTQKAARLANHSRLYDFDEKNQTAKVLVKPLHDKQVAIVGITLDQMKLIARPDDDTDFINAIETAKRTVDKIKADGIVHIIILSHLGLEQDRVLAAAVDGISLIVGGHSHTLQGDFSALGLGQLPYGETVNGTPILHAGKYAETLGIADIEFNADGQVVHLSGHNHFMLDSQFILQSSQEVSQDDYHHVRQLLEAHSGIFWDDEDVVVQQTILNKYRPALDALDNKILGFVPKNLIHTRLPSRSLPHGSEIAPWVSRSIYHEAKETDAKVDFALHNAGGVRQSLNKGDITLADVVGRILPFDLPLVKYQIRGKYLYQTLESAINAATNNGVTGTGAGSFPYTYGLKYFYDGCKPEGERIIKLQILRVEHGAEHWIDVEHEGLYIGVSSAYTASGKEGYDAMLMACWQESLKDLTLPGAFIRFMSKIESLDGPMTPLVHYTSHHAVE